MLRASWLLLLLAGLTVGGCGKELTAGGYREGEASAMAADEPGPSAASFSLAPGQATSQASAAATEGIVRVTASVSLISESGAFVPITSGAAVAELAIGTSTLMPLGMDSVQVGVYPAIRVTFANVVAEVEGLVLAGVSFTGTVAVDLAGGPLVVDAQVPLTVQEGDPATVILRLNSGSWLSLAQPVSTIPPTATVTATAFRDAITITAE